MWRIFTLFVLMVPTGHLEVLRIFPIWHLKITASVAARKKCLAFFLVLNVYSQGLASGLGYVHLLGL